MPILLKEPDIDSGLDQHLASIPFSTDRTSLARDIIRRAIKAPTGELVRWLLTPEESPQRPFDHQPPTPTSVTDQTDDARGTDAA